MSATIDHPMLPWHYYVRGGLLMTLGMYDFLALSALMTGSPGLHTILRLPPILGLAFGGGLYVIEWLSEGARRIRAHSLAQRPAFFEPIVRYAAAVIALLLTFQYAIGWSALDNWYFYTFVLAWLAAPGLFILIWDLWHLARSSTDEAA